MPAKMRQMSSVPNFGEVEAAPEPLRPRASSDPTFKTRTEMKKDLRVERYKLLKLEGRQSLSGQRLARTRIESCTDLQALHELGGFDQLEKEVQEIESRVTCVFWACIVIALASSFLWGYHTAVVSPAEFSTLYLHTELTWSVVVSVMVVGAVIGSMLGGPVVQKIGPKRTIILTGLANVTGATCLLFASGGSTLCMWIAIIGRVMNGMAAGLTMCAVPVYIGELAPLQIRGALNALPQFANCVGILASQLLGLAGQRSSGLFGFAALVAGTQLVAAVFLPLAPGPESTIMREAQRGELGEVRDKKKQECITLCQRLYGFNEEEAAEHVRVIVDANVSSCISDSSSSSGGLFSDAAYSRMTISVIVLNIVQQLSGFNAILQYSATFFRPLFSNPNIPTVLVGVANLMGSMSATYVMDFTPRKRLLAISLGGMLVSTVAVTQSSGMFVVGAVVSFALCFQLGLGPLPGCFASEMYEVNRRSSAQGLAVMMNNVANFLVTLVFPIVYSTLQAFTFAIFGAVLALSLVFSLMVIPETLHKTPEEVYSSLGGGAKEGYQPLNGH